MHAKNLYILVAILIIGGFGVRYLLNRSNSTLNINNSGQTPVISDEIGQESPSDTPVTSTPAPTLTFAPIVDTIRTITEFDITIQGTAGDMTIPKDPAKVKVYKKVNNVRIPITFDEVKVGQKATLTIIVPGKEAELVIEP